MGLKSAELQDKIKYMDSLIEQAGNLSDRNQLEAQRNELNEQLQKALTDENAATAFEKHVQDNGYIADEIKAGDYSIAELAHTPEDYDLIKIAFQKWAIDYQESFKGAKELLTKMKVDAQDRAAECELLLEEAQKEIAQLNLEKTDLEKNIKNAAGIITELEAQIKVQEKPESIEIAPLTAEQQDAQWKAENEKKNNRIKITDYRNADTSAISTRKTIVTLALTGEEVEIETLYLSRYVKIDPIEAEQLRADYADKKAEIELQQAAIPVLIEPDVLPVNNVTETDEAAEIQPFPTEIQSTESTVVEGSSNGDREVATEESEVEYITQSQLAGALNIMYNTIRDVSERVSALESGHQAVA